MAVVFTETFDTDVGSFTGDITRVASEGADFDTGYGSVTAGGGSTKTATRSFTAISSGVFRCDFWVNLSGDSETIAGTTKNSLFYMLPTAGAVTSANSITTLVLIRNSSAGASSSVIALNYRNSAGLQVLIGTFYRIGWLKVSVVANFTGDTFDLYLNDVLWLRGASWGNAAAADFSRVVMLNDTAAPATIYDEISVQDSYSLPSESVLVEHDFQTGSTGEIEDLVPQTQTRTQHKQKWLIPQDQTTYGAGTVGATNGFAPDSGKDSFPTTMCLPDGIVEGEFKSATSGRIYFGLAFRVWEHPTAGGGGIARIDSTAATVALLLPDSGGTLQTVATAALAPAANTTYSLKVEMRGRYYLVSYKANALDTGSYTLAITHAATSSATGGRGLLSQEYCGLYFSSVGAATNYGRKFRFTGVATSDTVKTIGHHKCTVSDFSVHEFYGQDLADTTIDLGGDAYIQAGHRSRADAGNRTYVESVAYNTTNFLLTRRRSLCLTEYEVIGQADCWFALLWRGPWIGDRITMGGATENFAPDCDFSAVAGVWDGDYKVLQDTGTTVSDLTDTAYHDWREDITNDSLPLNFQKVTAFVSGNNMRVTSSVRNNLAMSTGVHNVVHKFEGNGDPISIAITRDAADLVHGTAYEVGRGYLFETAAALDNDTIIRWRDNVGSPRALAFTTGSAKTDASGDINADGFNEQRGGIYEITCSGGVASWTVEGATQPAEYPVFRLHSWTNTNTAVTIAGVLASAGTDYLLDDLGGSIGLLQLKSVRTADTTIAISAPATVSGLIGGKLTVTGLLNTGRLVR